MILDNKEFPYIFIIEVKKLNSTEFNFLLGFADDYIISRMSNKIPEMKRNAMLIANVLRKYLIKKYFDISFDGQQIKFNECGKPYLFNDLVYFNVSYSEKYVVCAISDKNVGIDIQKIEKFNRKKVEYVFESEIANMIENSENPDLEYTKQWTKLESFLKYKGTGFVGYKKGIDENLKQSYFYKDDYVVSLHWD